MKKNVSHLTDPSHHEEAAYTEARKRMLEDQITDFRHNSYEQELREFSAIEAGDIEAWEKATADISGTPGVLAAHPLRNAKNLAIVGVTLASRASIRGGVSPETAFSLSDYYIQHIESLDEIDAVFHLERRAEYRFVCLVRDVRYMRGDRICVNYHTDRCKRYISAHIRDHLTVKSLAEELGVSPNYLSSLFLKHEGCTITEYIQQEKIRIASKMLVQTDCSLAELADSLGFLLRVIWERYSKNLRG